MIGSIKMLGNTSITFQKKPADVLTSNDSANCIATSIAFTN